MREATKYSLIVLWSDTHQPEYGKSINKIDMGILNLIIQDKIEGAVVNTKSRHFEFDGLEETKHILSAHEIH